MNQLSAEAAGPEKQGPTVLHMGLDGDGNLVQTAGGGAPTGPLPRPLPCWRHFRHSDKVLSDHVLSM